MTDIRKVAAAAAVTFTSLAAVQAPEPMRSPGPPVTLQAPRREDGADTHEDAATEAAAAPQAAEQPPVTVVEAVGQQIGTTLGQPTYRTT